MPIYDDIDFCSRCGALRQLYSVKTKSCYLESWCVECLNEDTNKKYPELIYGKSEDTPKVKESWWTRFKRLIS